MHRALLGGGDVFEQAVEPGIETDDLPRQQTMVEEDVAKEDIPDYKSEIANDESDRRLSRLTAALIVG